MESRSGNVYLAEELIREILLRLPVNALLRFKCVCKEWCALIGSQSFIDDHCNHESNRDCLLIQTTFDIDTMESEIEFTIYGDDGRHIRSQVSNYLSHLSLQMRCHLLGPANGIFCVVRPDLRRMALLNPATRKLKPLPPIPLLPQWTHLEYGFGFDHFSGDYKVVALERGRRRQRYFYVYNSSSDSWREAEFVDSSFNVRINTIYGGVYGDVFSNGVSHWINWDDACKSILGFDMRSESFQEIPVPDAIRDGNSVVDITTYGGDSIALLSSHRENVDLWAMLQGRDGLWTKCSSIALPQPSIMRPLCVWKNKNQVLIQTQTHVGQISTSALSMFDISTQKEMIFGSEFKASIYGVLFYKESLISVQGSERVDGAGAGADCIQRFFN